METVSIRYGPHVVGRYSGRREKRDQHEAQKRRGKGGSLEAGENQKPVFHRLPPSLGNLAKARDSHFPTAPTTISLTKKKAANPLRRAEGEQQAKSPNRTDHV